MQEVTIKDFAELLKVAVRYGFPAQCVQDINTCTFDSGRRLYP